MNIEYEATFTNINKDEVRKNLKEVGAILKRPEFLQKRTVYNLPDEGKFKNAWLRVRDEGDKITMSFKNIEGKRIESQKEIELVVDNYQKANEILSVIGCQEKSYQETKRELWLIDEVEITIDEWPFLEPFVEIEAKSEDRVKLISEKIGFDYAKAKFCSIDYLYQEKYNIDLDIINNQTPRIIFDMQNPFIQ